MDCPNLNNKAVLVTGAKGFIGTALRKVLQTAGATVYGVGRSGVDGQSDNMLYSAVDLTDAFATANLIKARKPDYIVHLAGCSVARREIEWVQKTFDANLVTTVNVLSAALDAGVRKTVIAGSLEQPQGESQDAICSSPYAASKWAATAYSKMFHDVYDMQVATARIFMVYGPGQNELQKMIPYVCLSAIAGETPKIMSGTRCVDWIYVDDVAEGLLNMLISGPGDGSHVDLGTGRLVSTGTVANLICEASGSGVVPAIGAVPDRKKETECAANIEQTSTQINWSADMSIEDGVELTLDWYRDQVKFGNKKASH